ncbi:MAG: recombination regulator RecX [Treponema sp.]|nr:recombination regulator RecX [Treponema sp.]
MAGPVPADASSSPNADTPPAPGEGPLSIISLETDYSQSDGTLKAGLSDGSHLFILPQYLDLAEEGAGLWDLREAYLDRELSGPEEEALRFAAECCQAERMALRLISRAEQSSMGLAYKLGRRGCGNGAIRKVISSLEERALLDDQRYAELWIRSRLASPHRALSPQDLRNKLRSRVDRKSAEGALEAVLDEETEQAMLHNFLERAHFDERESVLGLPLKYRLKKEGFSSSLIQDYFEAQSETKTME